MRKGANIDLPISHAHRASSSSTVCGILSGMHMVRIMQAFTPKGGCVDIDGQRLNINVKASTIGG